MAEDNEISFPDGAKITNLVSIWCSFDKEYMLLTIRRNSPTTIGGWANIEARQAFSRQTMSSLTSDFPP